MSQATFSVRGRNPDVLTCIANLSNDEVFTPPDFANEMLNTLTDAWAQANGGRDIWADSKVRFLDPFTKSGVFLREITARLTVGLETEIPDLQARVDHILTRQVFGIGITQLTAMIARRSLYCSKIADGRHSIVTSFDSPEGNIWYERTEHSWVGRRTERRAHPTENRGMTVEVEGTGRCSFCGANESEYGRGDELESHAYAFIHTSGIKARIAQLFGDDMHFDVIIGNPPYQLSDGGFGTSAAPIYQSFVEQAIALEPRYLSMVIPARWFAGGKGLDEFRMAMLSDERVRVLNDYLNSSDAFPGVELQGGICTFLWDRDHPGTCAVTTHYGGQVVASVERRLLEPGAEVFVRHSTALPILKKVMAVERDEPVDSVELALPAAKQFASLVSARKPFGLATTFRGRAELTAGAVKVYQNGGVAYTSRSSVLAGHDLVDAWKVFIGRAHGGQGHGKDTFPSTAIGAPFVGEPGSISTETYLCIGPFANEERARNALSYINTRLFRLLVLLNKPSQDATRRVYGFVPLQDFSEPWDDRRLYERYGIDDHEVEYIESMVRLVRANGE